MSDDVQAQAPVLQLHRCTVCGTRWLLWPDSIHGGGWNLLDAHQRPGSCCDNAAMGRQIEHLRDIPLRAAPVVPPVDTRPTCPECGHLVSSHLDRGYCKEPSVSGPKGTHCSCTLSDMERRIRHNIQLGGPHGGGGQ